MKNILSILSMLAAITAFAAPKQPIRVGTYEITNSFNRRVQAEKGTMSPQRMWCNSAEAVAEAIIDADCDVMGIQDVCDSIAGRREGARPLIDVIKTKGGDYDALVLSNVNPNFPLEGSMQNGTGVVWRASRFELRDYGIYWLSGIYDKPGRDKSFSYGGGNASFIWVKLYDRSSDKELIVASANVNGPSQNDKGKKITYHEINVANCRNLIRYMKNDVVPKGMPSIITLNAHNAPSHDGFRELVSDIWQDVHNVLNDEGSLDETSIKIKDTMNSNDESKLQGGRPDHILADGFTPMTYAVLRKKFPTSDGTLHYPSLHFPVIADLKY